MTAPDLDAQPAAAATVGRPNARALLPSLMALLPPTLPPHVGMVSFLPPVHISSNLIKSRFLWTYLLF
uniref:Uncharacterized protein n=1 Tax=Triticum urartu TaxID=4572 RepID=A0A8R7Q9S0_TRIUA